MVVERHHWRTAVLWPAPSAVPIFGIGPAVYRCRTDAVQPLDPTEEPPSSALLSGHS